MALTSKKYVFYGFIGLAIVAVTYFGFYFLKGSNLLKKTNSYFIYYDRIEGLNESSVVTVNGYKVGQVTEISFLPEKNYQLLVKIDISNDFLLPDSTIARIYSMDLMGTKGIELIFSKRKTYHNPGDILIGEVEQSLKDQVSYQMLPIKRQAEELMEELTRAITVIRYIFNENTRANLEKSFSSIKSTLFYIESSASTVDGWLSSQSGSLAKIISNVEYLTRTLSDNAEHLNNIFDNLSSFSDTLAALEISKTVIEANAALTNFNALMDKINAGEGSIGQLVQNDKLANELEQSAENLRKLLFDIQYNPKKYVNFSLLNIGRTVNITDENQLRPSDRRAIERQERKNERKTQKNIEKEQKDKKNSENSNKQSYIQDGQIKFYIQIRSAIKPIQDRSFELKNYTDAIEYFDGKYYKYLIFPHDDPTHTNYFLRLAVEDFPDAFPVALSQEKLISYSSVLDIASSKN